MKLAGPDLLAAVEKAKAAVRLALSRLGDPVIEALDLVSPEEFIPAVWRIPPPGRTDFLAELNVPTARKPTVVSAGLGMSRLRAWPDHKRHRAAKFLTDVPAAGLDEAWEANAGATVAERCAAVGKVLVPGRGSVNIMRLTVLAQACTTPGLAAAMIEALDAGLVLPSWPADAVDELRVASRELLDNWLAIETSIARALPKQTAAKRQAPAPAVGQGGPDAPSGGAGVLTEEAPKLPSQRDGNPLNATSPGPGSPDDHHPDRAVQDAATASAGETTGQHDATAEAGPAETAAAETAGVEPVNAVDVEVVTAALTDLTERHAAAVRAAAELADRIGLGYLPDERRIQSLTAFAASGDTAIGVLAAAGHHLDPGLAVGDLTLELLSSTLQAVAASAETANSLRREQQKIKPWVTVVGPAGCAEQLAQVRDLASTLVAADAWDDKQIGAATGLLALLDVVAAAAVGDTQAATEATGRAQQQLPPALAGLTIAALLNQLRLGPVDESAPVVPPLEDNTAAVAAGMAARPDPAAELAPATYLDEAAEPDSPTEPGVGAEPAVSPPGNKVGQGVTVVALHAGTSLSAGEQDREPVSLEPGGESVDVNNGDSLGEESGSANGSSEGVDDRGAGDIDTGNGAAPQLVRDLIVRRRLPLAYHAYAATGNRRRADALRILALSDAARSETSSTAGALRAALEEEQRKSPAVDLATQVLLLAGCVRACLVTADPTAGESVLALARLMQHLPNLDTFATTIGTASKHGLLYSPNVLAALAPVADADADVAAIIEAGVAERDRRRNLDFVRANQIVDLWWSRTGLIGSLLDDVINNRRSKVGDVLTSLRNLAKREDLSEQLTRLDNEIRATSSRPLQGQARRKLLEHARGSLDVVRAWVDAVLASPVGKVRTPAPPALTDLRQKVKAQWPAAEHELVKLVAEYPDSLTGDAVALCRDHLQRSADMLDGAVLRGDNREPDQVLYQDLLRAADLPFTDGGLPARPVTIDDITEASATDWDTAFQQRLNAEQFGTARQIITAVVDPARGALMRVRLDDASTNTLAELRALHHDVAARAARAARMGQLSDAAAVSVNSRVEATTVVNSDDAAWHDLGVVRRQLQGILDELPEHLRDAQVALRNRMINEVTGSGDSTQQRITAIEQRIDSGDLATAEEYLIAAAADLDLPSSEPSSDLERFGQLLSRRQGGINARLVAAARDGQAVGDLDFSALGESGRTVAAEGLDGWLELHHARNGNLPKSAVIHVMRLVGVEFQQMAAVKLPSATRRAWRDLTNVVHTGAARLPAFGSRLGANLRVMFCWGDVDMRTLFSWVTQDPGSEPVLVLYFSALSAAQRQALALACAQRPDKPVMVLDDVALAYLAVHGAMEFAAMERVLMPFAATNPYFPQAHADVPPEMFFGRSEEIAKICDPLGPSLVYGGRQLGKSAMLRAAARSFELVQGCVAIYLLLPNGVGESVKPDVLWESVSAKLTERGILPPKRTKNAAKANVDAAVKAWLAGDASRRLLLLVDECDRFFDEDARLDFFHTSQLRNMMVDRGRRFKAVFAGLHQVQRFAHLPNQPLVGAHLGDQIAVGPLSPLPAHRLMFTPMETLGIKFESDELIHRVLAYCNYQPKLLQLVGEELVKAAIASRHSGPPYTFTDADLDEVLDADSVRQRVRDTVQLTLNLDSRYKLIALVVALAAGEHGADYTMSASQLRTECQQWWPEGFAGQGADEFGSLLEEMRDLGVLATADSRWRLRSSNVLRLLGSASSIDEELCSPEWRTTVTKLSVEQIRRSITRVHIAPLTSGQLSRLISRKVHVRVIAGTPATGVSRIRQLLEEIAAADGAQFDLKTPASPASYGKELRAGAPSGKHRVVLSIPPNPRVDTIIGALEREAQALPQPSVTRTVVIVADVSKGSLLAGFGGPSATISEDLVVPLRKASATGTRSWLTGNDRMVCFGDSAANTALMTATGGWPILLDRAAEYALQFDRPPRICAAITDWLTSADGAQDFLTATGLLADPRAQEAFGVLLEYDGPVSNDELVGLCAEAGPDPDRTAAILRLLDVLVQNENDGLWRPDQVVAAAWKVVFGPALG